MIQLRCVLAVVAGLIAGDVVAALPATSAPRPNIVLIVADDLGFSDIGSYGGEIRTPHLDRLAREGVRYTQFYNNAVCVTTRASLMTGLYPRHGGSPGGYLRGNMVTLGEVMRMAGYGTTLIGKWHLGRSAPNRPIDRGFDEFYGLLDGACHYFNPAAADPPFMSGRHRAFAHNEKPVTTFPDGYYTTDAFSEHAVRMIRHYAEAKRPFFINLNYTAPHYPLHAPDSDIARYRGQYADGYQVLRQRRFKRLKELGILDPSATKLSRLDRKTGDFRYDYDVTPWARLEEATRRREEARMEVYAAMVDRMDQGIGRVLAALDETGLASNTVVIFLSDNGGCASIPLPQDYASYMIYNEGIPVGDGRGYEFLGPGWGWAQNSPFRRHKVWTYEGGICTPMILRWPGVTAPGAITAAPGHVVDFMPTLLELAGATYPVEINGHHVPPLEGQSLVPSFTGRETAPRTLYWEFSGNRAIRDGRWKLVWGASDKRWELYDLSTDRSETMDLAPQHSRRVTAMAADWKAWRERMEAP